MSPCDIWEERNGRVFACGPGVEPLRCACGNVASRLCDYPVDGGTCDEPLCVKCTSVAGYVDKLLPPVTMGELAREAGIKVLPTAEKKIAHGRTVVPDSVDYCTKHARAKT